MAADLILCNLKALTFDGVGTAPDLIGIAGNKICYVGDRRALRDLKGRNTRILDCAGGVAAPGFNDAHCHPLAFALTLRCVDCSGRRMRDIGDIQATLREGAETLSDAEWLRAAQYDPSTLTEKRPPTRWELDQAVPHLPVILVERAGQHCVLNSRALELCGISESTADSVAGRIHRDPSTGVPNGVVSGNHEAVASTIPPLSDREIEAGVSEANKEYLSLGITSVQDTSWSNGYQHWLMMKRLKERGLLTPRVALFPGIDSLDDFVEAGLQTGSGDEQLRVGSIKLALDESTGDLRPPQEALNQAALAAHRAGFQLAFHASDVYMLQLSLQAIHFVRQYVTSDPIRPRLEHCPVCPPALVPEIAHSGATIVAQPNLLFVTGPRYLREAAPEHLPWVFPFLSFRKHGIPLAFSSDSPLTPCGPLHAIHTAVTRIVADGSAVTIDQRLRIADAFKSYTFAGAWASLENETKGSIAVGNLADLVVFDSDPTQMTPDERIQARVIFTLIDGKVVWEQ